MHDLPSQEEPLHTFDQHSAEPAACQSCMLCWVSSGEQTQGKPAVQESGKLPQQPRKPAAYVALACVRFKLTFLSICEAASNGGAAATKRLHAGHSSAPHIPLAVCRWRRSGATQAGKGEPAIPAERAAAHAGLTVESFLSQHLRRRQHHLGEQPLRRPRMHARHTILKLCCAAYAA